MRAVFLEKNNVTDGIKSFVFKPEKKIVFEAGQFAFFNFNSGGKFFSKHFSFSSSPTQENIEFTTILSGSDYKNALDALQKNSEIEISAAMGDFTLKKSNGKPIVFLAGGIGITTAISMLRFLAETKQAKDFFLFYSNRNKERIAFFSELEKLQEKILGLKIVHTLTDAVGKEWLGETGYITAAMIQKHCLNFKDSVFFVCGPPAFVVAMQAMLSKELKIQNNKIVVENFSGY